MKAHPFCELFPLLEGLEFDALVADIQKHGLREPISLHPDGTILDGRNRWRACRKAGIEPTFRTVKSEPFAFVISENIKRRHLTTDQRAALAVRAEAVLEKLKKDAKERQGRVRQRIAELPDEGRSNQQAARLFHTNREYIRQAEKLKAENPKALEAVARGEKRLADVKREQKLRERRKREAARAREDAQATKALPPVPDRFRLFRADLTDLSTFSSVPDDSVDLVVTDPPYGEKFRPLYAGLAQLASRVLRTGGSLVCMAGQIDLPAVLSALSSSGLSYHWTCAYVAPGGQGVQVFPRKINCFWKPLLWFVKGPYSGEWVGDVSRSAVNDNEKDLHEWQQSESGMADILGRFSRPGQTVLDPCCGSGTTGIAAVRSGCFFVGADIEPTTLDTAHTRLSSEGAP